jgi:hypothetical protein
MAYHISQELELALGTPSINPLLFVSVQKMNTLSFEGRTDELRMFLLSTNYSEIEQIREEIRNQCNILVVTPDRTKHLGRPRYTRR